MQAVLIIEQILFAVEGLPAVLKKYFQCGALLGKPH
jgi:hypothetical protein